MQISPFVTSGNHTFIQRNILIREFQGRVHKRGGLGVCVLTHVHCGTCQSPNPVNADSFKYAMMIMPLFVYLGHSLTEPTSPRTRK